MSAPAIWLAKLVFAHLLTDFILQPGQWVTDRQQKHFASLKLYLHGLITGIAALLLTGTDYWLTAVIITVTHIVIDGWKSYRPDQAVYFLVDQALHLIVIIVCWALTFFSWPDILAAAGELYHDTRFWIIAAAYLFASFPAGIMIGKLTKRWQDQIREAAVEVSALADAGKWIGILERTIILTLILQEQYGAIGLLIAAKSILRFNQTNSQEAKTEYVLIGSLISIGLAIVLGIFVQWLIR
jgi:hypothetical protein